MKRALRAAFAAAGRRDGIWRAYKALDVLARCLAEPLRVADLQRRAVSEAALAQQLSPALTVLHGPFAGMRYPAARAAGSALIPKILGSYERELHPVIERLVHTTYSDIVDIGCAEGWYAIGLAMRLPGVWVHAFDTDEQARVLCRAMAEANGVADRVQIRSHCSEQALLTLALGPRALVVSDCEGYEAELFTPEVARRLARHDLLIEVHDRVDPALGPRLRERFAATHEVVVVDSVDDTRKLRNYDFAELRPFDATERRQMLSEGRGMVMEWLFLTSRHRVSEHRGGVEIAAVAA